MDPHHYSFVAVELHRCCLLRTLLSFTGQPTAAGGALLRPDLARALPRVSADGLTWTFRLRDGIRYAPPFGDREIVAGDVIRAVERALAPATRSDYAAYYHVIEGAQEFAAREADSISGLEAPDPKTLVIHLTRPVGDLGAYLTFPAAAPIPPVAAEGHADYGPFLVASGPYMIAGSEKLDFSLPPRRQQAVSGYRPGRSLTLVRNPSWDASTDRLRPAYVDRIEIAIEEDLEGTLRDVDAARLDFVVEAGSPPDVVRRYGRSAELRERLHRGTYDVTWATWMKLAAPPFDDLHVRKAVNLVLDKKRLRELIYSVPYYGVWISGEETGHLVPDSLQNNLLLDYDPYETPGHRGDVEAARAEMARSRYDRDRDGRCDNPVCQNVRGVANAEGPLPRMAAAIAGDLSKLGLRVVVRTAPAQTVFGQIGDPTNKLPLVLVISWAKDTPGAASFFDATFSRRALGESNFSLLGASRAQLEAWGFRVRSVPSVDSKIDECAARVGAAAFQCWAEADQLLMERIVPWAPFFTATQFRVVSRRISRFSFAQATTLPALDQIALKKGSS